MDGPLVTEVDVFLNSQPMCILIGEDGCIDGLWLSYDARRPWLVKEYVMDYA